ncbi:MAG TPA: ERG2 family protein [Polyangiaceae bacterium LLY-WYZ-14_1]|jgi:C-8 sterol isomerase|nr:ERG2 family protein [Polyangiaceae bacterium LLY-WYZ-14_1]
MAYVFDPETLHACVREGVGMPREEAMDAITAALHREYGEHVETGPRRWILNNAGGAMGQLTLLHCSLTEYLIFFGTPIGTEGHSGRYATDVYDWVFDGEMWVYLEGETDRTVFEPGSQAYLGPDQVKGYRIPDHAWMLEYARGPIATMLPFGLADTLVSTLDLKTLGKTLRGYTEKSLESLRRGKL